MLQFSTSNGQHSLHFNMYSWLLWLMLLICVFCNSGARFLITSIIFFSRSFCLNSTQCFVAIGSIESQRYTKCLIVSFRVTHNTPRVGEVPVQQYGWIGINIDWFRGFKFKLLDWLHTTLWKCFIPRCLAGQKFLWSFLLCTWMSKSKREGQNKWHSKVILHISFWPKSN